MIDKELINKQHGTMTKRTQDEILARIKEMEPKDFFGDQCSNLVTDITAEEALKRKGLTTPKQSVMCDNDIEHFYIYAKEFTLPITLKSLIGSHKNLRQENKIKHDEWLRELSAGRELGRKQGLEMVTEHEFVSVEKLKSMTINELVSFLYDGE